MENRGIGSNLLTMVLAGLAAGATGLLEPLVRFWNAFHLLGRTWPELVGIYLASGLVVGLAAGAAVYLGLLLRKPSWTPVGRTAYYLAATYALGTVLMIAPPLRLRLIQAGLGLPYAVLYPALLLLALAAILALVPLVIRPVLSGLIGTARGAVCAPRAALWLLLIALLVPVTLFKEVQSRYAGSGRPPRTELRTRPSEAPIQNVVFLLIDALRADHLTCYGYDRATSPVIDSLAARGVLFERCFSQGNRTELSMGSIFTSLYPSMHAVRHGTDRTSVLPAGIETLAELMRDAGLTTSSMVSNPYVKREWGLARGFDRLEEFHSAYTELIPYRYLFRLGLATPPDRVLQTPVPRAEVIVDRAIEEVDRIRKDPFFLYLHFMDVHHPYHPPPAYRRLYPSPGAASLDSGVLWTRYWDDFNRLPGDPSAVSDAVVLQMMDLYDGSIRYVDEQIGRFVEALDQRGLIENTLLIVTSDHGDEFLDHGDLFHKTMFLYDELIHVPLIVVLPGKEAGGRRIGPLVRHIDLMPTLVDLLALAPSEQALGRSLRAHLAGQPPLETEPAYAQSHEFVAIRTDTHKLMYDLDGGRGFCFDLIDDPGETVNRYGDESAGACERLMQDLMEFIRRITVPREDEEMLEIDEHTRKQLESLGYM